MQTFLFSSVASSFGRTEDKLNFCMVLYGTWDIFVFAINKLIKSNGELRPTNYFHSDHANQEGTKNHCLISSILVDPMSYHINGVLIFNDYFNPG